MGSVLILSFILYRRIASLCQNDPWYLRIALRTYQVRLHIKKLLSAILGEWNNFKPSRFLQRTEQVVLICNFNLVRCSTVYIVHFCSKKTAAKIYTNHYYRIKSVKSTIVFISSFFPMTTRNGQIKYSTSNSRPQYLVFHDQYWKWTEERWNVQSHMLDHSSAAWSCWRRVGFYAASYAQLGPSTQYIILPKNFIIFRIDSNKQLRDHLTIYWLMYAINFDLLSKKSEQTICVEEVKEPPKKEQGSP